VSYVKVLTRIGMKTKNTIVNSIIDKIDNLSDNELIIFAWNMLCDLRFDN
jgi:hypothetical protein